MKKQSLWEKTQKIMRFVPALYFIVGCVGMAHPDVPPAYAKPSQDASPARSVLEAKARLRQGVNSWSAGVLEEARSLFIQSIIQAKADSALLLYYVALTDFRLATHCFSSGDTTSAERWTIEGQQYLEKAMAADPAFAESFALYGYLLGLELALHPEKAMTLGGKSFGSFAEALRKESANPRIHLLKGIYLLYVPEEFGGGPDRALESLHRAASLFEEERVDDPLKPDWGKDEAYTYLGIVYKRKGEPAKAREFLEKALLINPDYGLAKNEIVGLDRNALT